MCCLGIISDLGFMYLRSELIDVVNIGSHLTDLAKLRFRLEYCSAVNTNAHFLIFLECLTDVIVQSCYVQLTYS